MPFCCHFHLFVFIISLKEKKKNVLFVCLFSHCFEFAFAITIKSYDSFILILFTWFDHAIKLTADIIICVHVFIEYSFIIQIAQIIFEQKHSHNFCWCSSRKLKSIVFFGTFQQLIHYFLSIESIFFDLNWPWTEWSS